MQTFAYREQIKTLQHALLLYGRAATEGRYRGRTRADFDNLHQSVHEFRVVDRSEQQSQEIADAAETPAAAAAAASDNSLVNTLGWSDDQTLDTNTLLSQLMAEVSSNVDEQGPWSQWWPPMEEVELPVTDQQGMPMLL